MGWVQPNLRGGWMRWRRAGMGKRGGARVIYFTRTARGEVVLILVYAKAKFDNIGADVLKALRMV